jgi:hypothetical protein
MKADRAAFDKAIEEIERGLPRSSPGRIGRQWKLIEEYERMKQNDWRPMSEAPNGVVILARGHDYGNPMNPYHYSLVINENGEWKGVGNETTWIYVVEWKYV